MKYVLVLLSLGLAAAAEYHHPFFPTTTTTKRPHNFIPIIHKSEVRDDSGQFSVGYKSGDGTLFEQQGILKPNRNNTGHVIVKQGSYSYVSPEGITISVSYTADENGFHPAGNAAGRGV